MPLDGRQELVQITSETSRETADAGKALSLPELCKEVEPLRSLELPADS